MNDLSIEVVACFVGLVLVALFANIIFRRLRFPCTIGLIFVGLALFNPSSTVEGGKTAYFLRNSVFRCRFSPLHFARFWGGWEILAVG
ncbi:MAG TPA: hypothetical protein GX689_03410, partial [Lentisphaerae bacterium]|nr:hypothetical protein [Lentisphaerota bacterium]